MIPIQHKHDEENDSRIDPPSLYVDFLKIMLSLLFILTIDDVKS